MPKTIASFQARRVIRRPMYRTERFVSRLRIHERIMALISSANETRNRRHTPVELSVGNRRLLARLEGELGGDDPHLRVLGVVEWYEANCGPDERLPWVENARSLYDKFSRLERQMEMRTRDVKVKERTVDDVVGGTFNGSPVLASAFRHDVLGAARGLDLGGASDADVAASLAGAYSAIEAARGGRIVDGVPGSLDLLRSYVEWLAERTEWRMTTRVLSIDSPAFNQFRRETAARHPREVDSVTGR
jgi:hypothetical protein